MDIIKIAGSNENLLKYMRYLDIIEDDSSPIDLDPLFFSDIMFADGCVMTSWRCLFINLDNKKWICSNKDITLEELTENHLEAYEKLK